VVLRSLAPPFTGRPHKLGDHLQRQEEIDRLNRYE